MTSIAATPARSPSVMAREVSGSRLWAWLGLATFVAGVVVTWSVQFAVPMQDLDAGGQQLFDAIDTSRNEVLYRVTSGLGYLVVAGLIAFGVGLRGLLARRAPESTVPQVMLGSILVTAAALGLAMSFRAQVFDTITSYQDSPISHITINRLQQDSVLAAWATMLAATLAAAVGGLREGLFPKPLAWFSVLVSAVIIVFCLAGGPFPANIPVLLWLAVVSIWAIRASARMEA